MPSYEKMVEYDIPAMIHVSTSCNACFHTTGAHYLNADTTAFMQCLAGDLFKDFPTLRFLIPHGGGAVPYHWGRFRGLAQDITDAALQTMHDAGVRGVRFNFVKRLVDFTPKDELVEIAGRIAELGWHVVIYFEAADLPELWDFFTAIPTAVVVDHMGRPDVGKPVEGPEFSLFLQFMREHRNVWTKVSCPERLSVTGPPALQGERHAYHDVVPFARRVVEAFPDRVLWGTDWPHPNLNDHMPDDGLLVDFIPHIAPTLELQQKLLVDNPMRLYWAE